jgi:hypothetical protein
MIVMKMLRSDMTGTGHDISLKGWGWGRTVHMTQIFHRAIGRTAVGRSLDQRSNVYPAGSELSVPCPNDKGAPGEVQRSERNDMIKRRSAQVDHRTGYAKNELTHIPSVLLTYGEEIREQAAGCIGLAPTYESQSPLSEP